MTEEEKTLDDATDEPEPEVTLPEDETKDDTFDELTDEDSPDDPEVDD
jgi:hypothetical protein